MDIDKVYYYNRNGTLMLTLNEDPYWCEGGEFKDWKWNYDEQFSKLRNFNRSKAEYPITISIIDDEKGSRDALCDIFDEDVLAGSPGYLLINGWKLPCYIVEAEREFWARALDYQIAFKIVSETSTWVRESTTTYGGIDTTGASDLGRDYSVEQDDTVSGRGYDSASNSTNNLMNSFGDLIVDSDGNALIDSIGGTAGANGYGYSIVSSYARNIVLPTDGNGYRVTFYGVVTNPVIYLDGKPVRVYTSILDGERLEVTSNGREKTIYKLSATGVKTNMFVYRDKVYSPFFSIGKQTELTYGDVHFDFTTIEQRSEPSWN